MSGRVWVTPTYTQGFIEGRAVVLRRGGDHYPSTWRPDDLPWKIHATCTDLDDARRIVRLLNDQVEP